MKIFAPLEVLKRYAEVLKIRMPIKKFSTLLLHSQSAEGNNMLEFKLTEIEGTEEEPDHIIRFITLLPPSSPTALLRIFQNSSLF